MHSSLITLVAILASSSTISALGINCRGSPASAGNCRMNDIIAAATRLDPNRQYNNGDHIVCCSTLAGNGLCAFYQGISGSRAGSTVLPLLQRLKDHNCQVCGSVPIGFPGSNDPKDGILTVNGSEMELDSPSSSLHSSHYGI
ncbi:hypothetical protein ABW20_dc0104293 [Dactylellina cionopaga]|nr:hypothetical protein ABW20_dc0104293 [Dactylellina cionopaga]